MYKMPIIKPISDLRNKAAEISDICHNDDQPVFITKNGKGDIVVMSQTHYENIENLIDLYQQLGEAESLASDEKQGILHQDLMDKLRKKIK